MASLASTQDSAISSNSTLGFNLTSLNGLPKELVLALPRLISRAGAFAFYNVPDRVDHLFGLRHEGSVIAEATAQKTQDIASAVRANVSTTLNTTLEGAEATSLPMAASRSGILSYLSFKIQTFGGMFAYLTSKWAILCFTLALILNRTSVYASSRRQIRLPWAVRLALRIIPIILFAHHTATLLQAIRCQTSPHVSSTHPRQSKNIAYTGDGGFLYRMSSAFLFFEAEHDSCMAVKMLPSTQDPSTMQGSFSLLWPLFKSLCIGHLIETLSCTVQGRTVMTETGLSIFEHSLAFAEAEAVVSSQLGFTRLTLFRSTIASRDSDDPTLSAEAMKQGQSFAWMHTTPEILLMALISSMNNLTSHILAVFDKQSKFRLVNTGFWGICFMLSIAWGFVKIAQSDDDVILSRFPTVCIFGFVPHLLLATGILLCGAIYLVAFILTVLSPSDDDLASRSFSDRALQAHENLQMHTQLTSVPFDMKEDFYTALMKFGFAVLTGASEAVYLNEGERVTVRPGTWLEDEQSDKFEKARARIGDYFAEDAITGVSAAGQGLKGRAWRSGYGIERKTTVAKNKYDNLDTRMTGEGVGMRQRTGRMIMTFQFFTAIFWLWWRFLVVVLVKALDASNVERRPAWLRSSVRNNAAGKNYTHDLSATAPQTQAQVDIEEVDVESEMKRRLQMGGSLWDQDEEWRLDERLYSLWKKGGWWGERDESGTYAAPSEQDDDTTSLISFGSDLNDWGFSTDVEEDGSGAHTPTQQKPYPFSQSPTPDPFSDHTLDPIHLASLLDPKSAEQRQEASMLAHHLTSDRVLTRSQYKNVESLQGTAALSSTINRPTPSAKLRPDEEVELLEQLIISRRAASRVRLFPTVDSGNVNVAETGASSWAEGASGLGSGGPQCVVCQSAPRTILSWPCRCLSLCEECRVSLAKGNFGTCVCCRREVVGFSRLFVP